MGSALDWPPSYSRATRRDRRIFTCTFTPTFNLESADDLLIWNMVGSADTHTHTHWENMLTPPRTAPAGCFKPRTFSLWSISLVNVKVCLVALAVGCILLAWEQWAALAELKIRLWCWSLLSLSILDCGLRAWLRSSTQSRQQTGETGAQVGWVVKGYCSW